MTSKNIFIKKNINDIQIKMLREKEKCYIKIIPTTQKSSPKKLFITINGEKHQWEIFDENGRGSHRVYLKGKKIQPRFYMIDDNNIIKIFCKKNDININKLSEELKNTIPDNYGNNCISSDVYCWGVNIYKTSRAEKSPFCFM
jgi:hypothetical protein